MNYSGDIGGIASQASLLQTADGHIGHDPVLPAAKVASITDYAEGPPEVWTLDFGAVAHGLEVGDEIDVWIAGVCSYGVEISAKTDNYIVVGKASTTGPSDVTGLPVDGLPVASTAMQQVLLDTDFDSDLVQAIGLLCAKAAHVTFANEAGTELIKAVTLTAAELWHWFIGGEEANPLGADKDVGRVMLSHGDTSATPVLSLGILYDSTV